MRDPASGWRAMDSTALLPIEPMENAAPSIVTQQPIAIASIINPDTLVGITANIPLETTAMFSNLPNYFNAPVKQKIQYIGPTKM
jgi:hypothetical protein